MSIPNHNRPGTLPILLVDDDELVRDTTRAVLEQAGWTVVTACDGIEGLAIVRRLKYEVALVIADVVMPVMSGRQMVREMRAEHPTVPVLMMTGFAIAAEATDPDTAGLPILEKPFATDRLLSAIRGAVR